jgi:hypothetical protein
MIDDDLADDLPLSTAVGDPGPVPIELEASYACPSVPFALARGKSAKPWRTEWPEEFPVDIRPIDYNGHVPGQAA